MPNRLTYLEGKKIEVALKNRQSQKEEISSQRVIDDAVEEIMKPVADILSDFGLTVNDLETAMLPGPDSSLDYPLVDKGEKRSRLAKIGIIVDGDGNVDLPVLRDPEQRATETVNLYYQYRENKARDNTIDSLLYAEPGYADELESQRRDLEILLEGTGLEIEVLGPMETDAYAGHASLWEPLAYRFEKLLEKK